MGYGLVPVRCAAPYRNSNFAIVEKKTLRSSQCATERVQKLRGEYWEQVQNILPENLVFLDETGVELGRHLLG